MSAVGKKRSRSSALGRDQPSRAAKKTKVNYESSTPKTKRRSSRAKTPKKTKKTPKTTRRTATPKSTPEPPKPKRRLPEVPEEEEVYWKHWKQIFLVGTEWENYDAIYDIDWDFDHLNEHLVQGFLHDSPNPKYIFGTTESFEMAVDSSKPDEKEVFLFPVITVVDAKVPPPTKLGITSVQRGEELKDMKELKMEWAPYFPDRNAPSALRKKAKVFFLTCTQRRQTLEKMSVDQLKEFEYAIPYIWFPKNDLQKDFDTDVHIIHEIAGRGLNFSFDWTFDELDEIVDELLSKEEKEKYGKELEDLIKSKVNERKTEIRKEKQAIKDKISCLSDRERESLDNLKCYKYYPQNEVYPIERTSFINRYYGRAAEVFPPVQAAIDYSCLKEIIPASVDDDSKPEEEAKAETK